MKSNLVLTCFILAGTSFVAAQIVLHLILYFSGFDLFDLNNWSRADSGLYMSIARNGYYLEQCPEDVGKVMTIQRCGNAGWFPAYPYLIRLLTFFYKNDVLVAIVISKMAYLINIFLIVYLLKLSELNARSIVLAFLAAFGFSFIYFNAVFPMSLLLLFVLLSFYFYLRRSFFLTGCCCYFATLTYPSGFLLSIALALSVLFQVKDKKFFTCSLLLGMGFLGAITILIMYYIQVGDWAAFYNVQSKYENGLYFPPRIYINYVLHLWREPAFAGHQFMHLQSLLIGFLFLILGYQFIFKSMYRDPFSIMVLIYLVIFFVYPWSVGKNSSFYRAESLLMPLVFVMKDWKTRYLYVSLMVFILIGIPISYLFFAKIMI
jgi:hypothetical protein